MAYIYPLSVNTTVCIYPVATCFIPVISDVPFVDFIIVHVVIVELVVCPIPSSPSLFLPATYAFPSSVSAIVW